MGGGYQSSKSCILHANAKLLISLTRMIFAAKFRISEANTHLRAAILQL
jgi:hypothetical protein